MLLQPNNPILRWTAVENWGSRSSSFASAKCEQNNDSDLNIHEEGVISTLLREKMAVSVGSVRLVLWQCSVCSNSQQFEFLLLVPCTSGCSQSRILQPNGATFLRTVNAKINDYRGGGAGGAIAPPKIPVGEHCSP